MLPESVRQDEVQKLDFTNWLANLYRSLDLDESSAAITNDTRLWSGWQRVSLFLVENSTVIIRSISGAQSLDHRSSTVRLLEDVAQTCLQAGGTIESPSANPLPALTEYHERCRVQHVVAMPVHERGKTAHENTIGILVFDLFEDHPASIRPVGDLEQAVPFIANALHHAIEYRAVQTGPVRRFWNQLTRTGTRRVLFPLLMAGIGSILLMTVQTELIVYGSGSLRPKRQADLFAGVDGLIEDVPARTGMVVSEGTELIQLKSPELQLTLSELLGELATVTQQISDLEKLRTDPQTSGSERSRSADLAVRREELKSTERNLQSQIQLLNQQLNALTLTSPIAGTILTTDLETLLPRNRPVRKTDRLLRIADLSGPWIVDLSIDQRDLHPVMQKIEANQTSVSFVTADAPSQAYAATIQTIAPAMVTESGRSVTLKIQALVTDPLDPGVRPGSTVQFRIECGQRSVGSVWFRRLFDKLMTWWSLFSS